MPRTAERVQRRGYRVPWPPLLAGHPRNAGMPSHRRQSRSKESCQSSIVTLLDAYYLGATTDQPSTSEELKKALGSPSPSPVLIGPSYRNGAMQTDSTKPPPSRVTLLSRSGQRRQPIRPWQSLIWTR
ncbi:hypothetical protein MRX96_043519 [Rhipicephalus microplus]